MKQEEIELTFCRAIVDSGLSLRLAETAYYIALGFRYAEIAKMRGVTTDSVRNDVAIVHQRLGVQNAIQLIRVLFGAPAKHGEE